MGMGMSVGYVGKAAMIPRCGSTPGAPRSSCCPDSRSREREDLLDRGQRAVPPFVQQPDRLRPAKNLPQSAGGGLGWPVAGGLGRPPTHQWR